MLFDCLFCLFAFIRLVSNVRRSRVGSNDAEFDDDPEDPNYVEDQVEEFEGKFYRPLLDHVEPNFS